MAGNSYDTPPFLTLDHTCRNPGSVLEALNGDWKKFIESDDELTIRLTVQGISDPSDRKSISWDDATLLWVSICELDKNGRPPTLEISSAKERMGRFPARQSSPYRYLIENIRPRLDKDGKNEGFDNLLSLLSNLVDGLSSERVGDERFVKGSGGLALQGWLSLEDAKELSRLLQSRCWMVSREEPLDGGVNDVAQNLVKLLKKAIKKRMGVILRSHS